MKQGDVLSGQESIELISRMISTVQNDIQDNSFHYLLWGWLVLVASAGHYLLMQLGYMNPWITWVILMPLGGIASMVYGRTQNKQQKIKTYMDDIMKYVMIAFMVSLFTVLLFMSKLGLSTYPMVLLVYGIWLFISGGAIRFRPLIIGGIINWILGIAAFFATFENQLLLLAMAVLLGYVIPGHMLRNKHHQKTI
ncbi:MAG TPA: hypothetical protein VFW78_12780 [Bacteroidia bacterium]|nr:hypothetical protein [Bacteroidia bacterium]